MGKTQFLPGSYRMLNSASPVRFSWNPRRSLPYGHPYLRGVNHTLFFTNPRRKKSVDVESCETRDQAMDPPWSRMR